VKKLNVVWFHQMDYVDDGKCRVSQKQCQKSGSLLKVHQHGEEGEKTRSAKSTK